MKKKPTFRVIALVLVAIMMMGVLPVFAADEWKTYTTLNSDGTPNETDFSYTGNWIADSSTGDMYGTTSGSTISFTFVGEGFSVDAFVNVQNNASIKWMALS